MSIDILFTKENLDKYLKEVAKEYRKRSGGIKAEMILVGGASVLLNYGFREMTYDIDAAYRASSVMKEAINAVGDKYGLPNGWLNTDFTKTESYTPYLAQYSEYYRTYSNVLEIRTVKAEYLVAMKLVSGRRYKKDLSDIIGILCEQQKAGRSLSYIDIDKAMINLYGRWEKVDEFSKSLLDKALSCDNLEELFIEQSDDEANAKAMLIEIDRKYPKVVNKDNVDEVIAAALAKKKKQ